MTTKRVCDRSPDSRYRRSRGNRLRPDKGGAPEGLLAAVAPKCVGGQFQDPSLFRNDDEKARARKWGVTGLDRIYHLDKTRTAR